MVHMREQEKTLGSFAMLFFGMESVCLVFGLSTQMLQLVWCKCMHTVTKMHFMVQWERVSV